MKAFLHMAVKNGEIAEKILKELGRKDSYLEHVVEEGKRAKKILGIK